MLSSFTELLKQESSEVSIFVRLAEEIETNNGSIKLKYAVAYCVLSGQSCDKGGHPYQHLALLIEARNRLMHMKPNDFSVEARPGGTPMESDLRFMEKFRALGILDTSQGILPLINLNATQSDASLQIAIPFPLNFRIATGAAACWACNTAADVVDSILKVVPDGRHKPNLLELCKYSNG
jgi:hypothetical protein